VIIILLLIVLYPKNCRYEQGGYVLSNPFYKQDCSCFGLKYESCEGKFDFYECADMGAKYYCAGIPMNKRCFKGTATELDIEFDEIECDSLNKQSICGPKGMGENYDVSFCDKSCNVDEDCKFVCGCGAISKNEICNDEGIMYDCEDLEVRCENNKCI